MKDITILRWYLAVVLVTFVWFFLIGFLNLGVVSAESDFDNYNSFDGFVVDYGPNGIFVLQSNVTDFTCLNGCVGFNSVYDVGKVYLTLRLMYFIGFGILIFIIFLGISVLLQH